VKRTEITITNPKTGELETVKVWVEVLPPGKCRGSDPWLFCGKSSQKGSKFRMQNRNGSPRPLVR